jgi:hypothetical protein
VSTDGVARTSDLRRRAFSAVTIRCSGPHLARRPDRTSGGNLVAGPLVLKVQISGVLRLEPFLGSRQQAFGFDCEIMNPNEELPPRQGGPAAGPPCREFWIQSWGRRLRTGYETGGAFAVQVPDPVSLMPLPKFTEKVHVPVITLPFGVATTWPVNWPVTAYPSIVKAVEPMMLPF